MSHHPLFGIFAFDSVSHAYLAFDASDVRLRIWCE